MSSTAADGVPALANPALERMRAGEVALGMSIRMGRSPDVVRVAFATGHDFVFIDRQHSVFDLETVTAMAHTALGCGITPMVRVRGISDPDTTLLLDNGVTGIVFPNIATADEARVCVDTVKFPPIGRRSVTGGYPHFNYAEIPLDRAVPLLNANTVVSCMVETVEGLANIEEIAAVPGLDVLMVGTNDLLFDMGKAGQFDDPEIDEALSRTISAADANGVFAGCGGNRDHERQVDLVRRGIRFMTTQTDIGFLTAGGAKWTADIRRGVAAG